ncbi:hypothetical protein BDR22DRAFT_972203 [Usnea florida]
MSAKSHNLHGVTSLVFVHVCAAALGGDGIDRVTSITFTKIRNEDMPELVVQAKDERGLEIFVLDAFEAFGGGGLSSLRRCYQQTVDLLVHDQNVPAFGQ